MNKVFILVLDGAGVGALPDAEKFGDAGSNTLGHVLHNRELMIENLISLGLGKILNADSYDSPVDKVLGAYGKMAELSPGKDTISGHWELAGLVLKTPFPLYPHGFPAEIIRSFENIIGCKTLGNIAASGTEIINKLGEEHLRTGFPIVYTSADSVFQIAAHTDIVPLETLYEWCLLARKNIFVGKHAVGRVIARPFKGKPGSFYRLNERKDFSLDPFAPTLLDLVQNNGRQVWVVGKVMDIFSGKGVTRHLPGLDNNSIMEAVSFALDENFTGLLWANLIDFDMLYGHRNDVEGYAAALEVFDRFLGDVMKRLNDDDMLVITADHGCDPTFKGTDHTREYVPLLIYGRHIAPVNLGTRESFADLGATVAELLCGKLTKDGRSFAGKLLIRGEERG
ncbi:MAG: phosphopentomutase [Firmicutes bacterium]|nr:phosphopentomutase [Bacillota bacterium]